MKLYKYLLIVVLSIFSTVQLYADELTQLELSFRSSIMQFLKEEGFMPTIDESDNSVNFKKEGTLFWVNVSGSSKPLYIEIHRSGLKVEDVDNDKLLAAINQGNRTTRCAKAYLNKSKSSVLLAVEMFYYNIEEFKYTFYKNVNELESLRNTVYDTYQELDGASSSSSSGNAQMSKFFPVYGLTVGKVTTSDLESRGYTVKTIESGAHHCDVQGLTFWDHNKDNIFEYIYMTRSDAMPDQWINVGLTWHLSYNQLVDKFKSWGFVIEVKKSPTTKVYSGRNTLSAEIYAKTPDESVIFDFSFEYGNDNNEGYSVDSRNTLYSLRIRTK
jgi:hypothetical protein